MIQPSQDAATYDSTGNRSTLEEPQPGDAIKIHVDAVGATSNATRLSTTAPIEMPCWGSGTLSFEWGGYDNLCCIAVGLGSRKKHETFPPTRHPTSNPNDPSPGAGTEGENQADGQTQQGPTNCLCQESDVSVPTTSHVQMDRSLGIFHDNIGGNGFDRTNGAELCDGEPRNDVTGQKLAKEEKDETIELVGGVSVRFKKIEGRWYRPMSSEIVDGQTVTKWSTHCQTADGTDPSEFEVPQEVYDTFKSVQRGGIALPAKAVKNLDAVANLLGVNEEIGLVLQAYAWGFASKDESFKVLGTLVAIGATAAITMAFTGGASLIAGKLLAKRAVRQFLKWAEKKAISACEALAAKRLKQWIQKTIPKEAREVLQHIRTHNGTPPKHYKGGRPYQNRDNALPQFDSAGNPITYKEYDIFPKVKGQSRGSGRIVVGSDGKAYHSDHYGDPVLDDFTEMQ